MEKLNYGNYNTSVSDIAFSATNGYVNPSSELEKRKQLSYPLKEVKDFVNNTVSVDSNDNAVQLVVSDTNSLQYRTSPDGDLVDVSGGVPDGGTANQVVKKNSSNVTVWGDNVLTVLTTAPTQANTDGVKVVYLESEPATKYSGYIYLIKE